MNGVMMPDASAGSNQGGASETWMPQVSWLPAAAQAGRTGPDSARELEAARRIVADLEDRLNVARADLTRQDVSAVHTEMTARHQEDQAEESIQGYTLQLSTLAREESERSIRQKEQLLARQAAVDAAEDRLRTAGAQAVGLETAVDNLSALSFYKKHGYSVVRTWPRYYANGVDALVMKKKLQVDRDTDPGDGAHTP